MSKELIGRFFYLTVISLSVGYAVIDLLIEITGALWFIDSYFSMKNLSKNVVSLVPLVSMFFGLLVWDRYKGRWHWDFLISLIVLFLGNWACFYLISNEVNGKSSFNGFLILRLVSLCLLLIMTIRIICCQLIWCINARKGNNNKRLG